MSAPSTHLTRVFQPPTGEDEPFQGSARLDWSDAAGAHSVVVDRRVVVGSSPHADVVLHDPTVSRLHAELIPSERGVWVRDLQSSNGTWLQGVQIDRAIAGHHGRLRFGQTPMVLTHVRPSVAAAPAAPAADSFGLVLGGSRPMRALYKTLARVAVSDSPVLITGETGTGKEVIARAIHAASPRADKPFVVVDCAALPESLLDAELFGHVKGAFTGAVNARAGALEAAEGGTVFLDEIGELPRGVQPKLLRALEAKTVRRVGENQHRDVNVRFLCATHRDLLQMVSTGEFREDLYFRLSVLFLELPPLRERLDDIERLVQHFLGTTAPVDPRLLEELRSREWSGNVRELRNFVDRMRALGFEQALEMTAGPAKRRPEPALDRAPATAAASSEPAPEFDGAGPLRSFRQRWLAQGECRYVYELLDRHGQNVTAAAREAGIDRTYLYKLMRKYGIAREAT